MKGEGKILYRIDVDLGKFKMVKIKKCGGEHFEERFASARKYSSEATLSLRSRRSGTKFAFSYETAH